MSNARDREEKLQIRDHLLRIHLIYLQNVVLATLSLDQMQRLDRILHEGERERVVKTGRRPRLK